MFCGKDNENIKWDTQLDDKNVYKLIYSLQVIESFLEDIEITSENIDSFSNEESILGQDIKLDDIKKVKIEWMKNFITQNGFSFLIKILEKRLAEYSNNLKNKVENSLMNNICLDLLLRITRIFFASSLNKFPIYRKITKLINKIRESAESQATEELPQEGTDDLTLNRKGSSKIDENTLESFFSGDLGDKIINSLDYNANSENMMNLLCNLMEIPTRSREENSILETSFAFLIGILGFAPSVSNVEKKITESSGNQTNSFERISMYGVLNNDSQTRILFSNSLITLSKACQHFKRFELLAYLFNFTFKIITNMEKEQEINSSELFDFFSTLFEIYLSDTKEFELGNSSILLLLSLETCLTFP